MTKFDYSKITNNLYVGTTPLGKDYDELVNLGIKLTINMRIEWPTPIIRKPSSIKELWVPSIDSRFFPINQERLQKTALEANEFIKRGEKVYVFCRKGRHRSVVMTSSILILQGKTINETINLISAKRPIADFEAIQVSSAIELFHKNISQKLNV